MYTSYQRTESYKKTDYRRGILLSMYSARKLIAANEIYSCYIQIPRTY